MRTEALIGRDAEITELEARLRTNRLVTVVGPGGVGKTALARTAAERVADGFPLGVRHVDLTRIDDEQAVPGTLAAQLGFDSFDALLSSPNDRPLLLVVDNCEHLLDATAASLEQVLGACQQPTVLATSRSPLELPGESVVSLPPLPLPTADGDPAECPSVQLFLVRCRDAGATVATADLPVVVELCRRLDGLALALEIAAARARTMSISEIGDRLAASVDVLERPRFRGDPRHRSVADTIRWSYDLLGPEAAELFAQLAVFSGPFGADAARAVIGSPGADRFDAVLDELVNASLVSADTSSPETRYRLLDTVRHFALAQLERDERLRSVYDRFVDHVLATLRRTLAGATSSWRPSLIGDLVASYDDVAEALRWCNSNDPTPDRAHALCSIMWTIIHQAHAEDIAVLARQTMARWPDQHSAAAAQATATLATAEYVTGHPGRAVELAERALATLDEPTIASITLRRVLGQARRALGDLDAALHAFEQGSRIGHELGVTAMAIELEIAAAQVRADRGETDEAIAALDEIVARAAATDSAITESWARTTVAWVLLRSDVNAAMTVIGSALDRARQLDYPIAIAVNLRSRAFGELLIGDRAAATATVTELLDELLRRGALSNARVLADVAAALALRSEHPSWPVLTATARALPISTMANAHFELIQLPDTAAPPIPRHDVFAFVRNVLADLATPRSEAAPSSAGAAVDRPAESSIHRRGDTCEISFAGRAITVRSSKGITDLVRLIEGAGAEVHCLDLVEAAVEQPSTGELIDSTARREYEERIRELQDDLLEAEHDNDYARAYRYQVELDSIVDHLTAALGRHNRSRKAADNAERARSAVTHRLRSTIRQLDKLHPPLGRHLDHAITTGFYCAYRPENAVTWSIH